MSIKVPVLESSLQEEAKKALYPAYVQAEKEGLLKERIEALFAYYENCHLCPRNCRVNRLKGETGVCRATARVKVSSAFPHFGEEAPLVGRAGSGTIFFSNCGLRCVYCQNYTISIQGEGIEISDEQLAEIMLKVQGFGCHNINLVTPTHYVPNIIRALRIACQRGLRIPLVYNTGGYDNPEMIQLLDGLVDIYLPDLKYNDPSQAATYSEGAYNYPYYAKLAIKEMYRQVGDLIVDERGIAKRGLILRHLVLPNNVSGTKEVIRFIAEELSPTTYVNLMDQYRPEHRAKEFPAISRRLKREEFQEALKWARQYGLKRLDRSF
ncbi:MAG: radical SAM protein [Candidatus Aminicenantes bacterium]|nr:radical SAM protein [Candidatus Aminicenantes bacterium]